MPKVWLITGASSGLGQEIALAALKNGDTVVATARSATKLASLKKTGAITVTLDVRASDEVLSKIVGDIVQKTERIDILVNNAGYILAGGVEECNRKEVREQFETNVFGQLNVIRAVLPFMRACKSGVVANLGSIGSWQGSPAAGLYCATKACASILSESLRSEVAHLGIEVTAIEPGYFRTNFLSQGHKVHAASTIKDIKPGVDATLSGLEAYNHKQPGDPAKAAQLIVEALTKSGRCRGKPLPARLPMGSDAIQFIGGVLDKQHKSLKEWGPLASTTDCASDVRPSNKK